MKDKGKRVGISAILAALVAAVMVLGVPVQEGYGRTALIHATVSQEWNAVQIIVGPNINPQAFLEPCMDAIGSDALRLAATLQLTGDQFLSYQSHPAYMMTAIQRFLRTLSGSSEYVFVVESMNQQLGIFNTNGLTPAETADVIKQMISSPDATTYLAAFQPTSTPTPAPNPAIKSSVPLSAFLLPVSVGGVLAVGNFREGTGCGTPCPPPDQFIAGSPATFLYETKLGIYKVHVFSSTAPARNADYALMTMNDPRLVADPSDIDIADPFDTVITPVHALTSPVDSIEWMRGGITRLIRGNGWNIPECYVIVGDRINNVMMVAQADVLATKKNAHVTCDSSIRWATHVIAALHTRVENALRHGLIQRN